MAALQRRMGVLHGTIGRPPLLLLERQFTPRATKAGQRVAGSRLFSQQSQQRPRFSSRLRAALRDSKIQWYPIPIALGVGFLGFVQFYKVTSREKERQKAENGEFEPIPKKRPRVRPDGPWYRPQIHPPEGK